MDFVVVAFWNVIPSTEILFMTLRFFGLGGHH